jgi:anaerobic ribonucleoside-triphosphate reductase activating protein
MVQQINSLGGIVLYYSGLNEIDSTNGIGVGVSLFVSGCNHHCKGCFNPETWNFSNGKPFTEDTMLTLIDLVDRDYIDFFSVLGGEPYDEQNIDTVIEIVSEVRNINPNIKIFSWSGFTFEELSLREKAYKLMSLCDYLIDGEFEIDKKDLNLQLRGSSNQRVIDLKKSLADDKVVIYS